MKYLPLLWAGLWRKPLRTTLTTLALVIAFVQFGLLQGINEGFGELRDSARDDGLYVNSRYGLPMPIGYREQIVQIPGVKKVIAVDFVGGPINGNPKTQIGVGLAEEGFFDFYSWLDVSPAQLAELRESRTGVVVGEQTAARLNLKAGDRFSIKGPPKKSGGNEWVFDVLAVIQRRDIPGLAGVTVGNFEYLNQERTAGADMVAQFLVLTDDPALSVAAARAIDDRFLNSGAPTRTSVDQQNVEQTYEDDTTHTMVNAIVLATFFALLLMTSNSMMQTFRDRVPEFGVLKALGFSDRQVLGIVLVEAVLQCVAGALLGMMLAGALAPYVKKMLTGPTTVLMHVSWSLVLLSLLIAGLVALASAALPAWRAGRMQVVDALAGR